MHHCIVCLILVWLYLKKFDQIQANNLSYKFFNTNKIHRKHRGEGKMKFSILLHSLGILHHITFPY